MGFSLTLPSLRQRNGAPIRAAARQASAFFDSRRGLGTLLEVAALPGGKVFVNPAVFSGGSLRPRLPIAASVAALLFAGCASPGAGLPASVPAVEAPAGAGAPLGKYIKHVVFIVQENRSFENLFAGWPGADAPMVAKSGTKSVQMKPIAFVRKDLSHDWVNAIAGWDHGKMDGFSNNYYNSHVPAGTLPYSYLEHSAIAPYRAIASQYVLADHMFPTMFGASFTAHLDLIAGTTNVSPTRAVVDLPNETPWGCDAPAGTTTTLLTPRRELLHAQGPFPCFTQFKTMADTLDAAGVSWKYYAPNILNQPAWSPFDAIKNVRYGADWTRNVISPQTQVLADAASGNLPSVAWVTPDEQDSDHPGAGSDTGPSWVASVVNAIGQGPDWKTTAIVLVWDDWGGWYDDVPPPQRDFRGLGIRVGCVIVSPYAKAGYVSHTVYEFGSMIKLAEQAFRLPLLGPVTDGYTDGRANSMLDSFDFTQSPRPYKLVPAKYPAAYFLHRPPSLKVPDNE
jgi:phospholipase C